MSSEPLGGEVTFVDRYSVFGPPNGCRGPCEGTGWVPVWPESPSWLHVDDTSIELREGSRGSV